MRFLEVLKTPGGHFYTLQPNAERVPTADCVCWWLCSMFMLICTCFYEYVVYTHSLLVLTICIFKCTFTRVCRHACITEEFFSEMEIQCTIYSIVISKNGCLVFNIIKKYRRKKHMSSRQLVHFALHCMRILEFVLCQLTLSPINAR